MLVGVIAAVTVFEVNVATDPSVAGAPAIVVAIDRAHATEPEMIGAAEHIAKALVASEDATFYANHGVDVVALLRAFWGYVTGQDLGGSTIEIQLAHMLYPSVTEGLWGRVRRVLARTPVRYALHQDSDPLDVSLRGVLRAWLLRDSSRQSRIFRRGAFCA